MLTLAAEAEAWGVTVTEVCAATVTDGSDGWVLVTAWFK